MIPLPSQTASFLGSVVACRVGQADGKRQQPAAIAARMLRAHATSELTMKPNRFRMMIEDGRVPIGHMLDEFGSRGMAQILNAAGVDFVLLDLEHSGFTIANVADQVAWFAGTEVAPLARVPQIEYHLIARCLDVGALGIMVPDVRSAGQARAIVAAVKYGPLGVRRVGLGGGNTGYRAADPAQFLSRSNDETTVICQIESTEGLGNLEEIAATPGVDVLWVGHGDLSQSMGIVGQYHHADFRRALRRVVQVARNHGLAAGIQPGSLNQAQEWLAMGYNAISYGNDIRLYASALMDCVSAVRALSSSVLAGCDSDPTVFAR